jgi:hypothetical protein
VNAAVPVVVFAHRRQQHLRRTLDALELNEAAALTPVTVFCDGPRDSSEAVLVDEVLLEAARPRGFLSLRVIPRNANAGLSASITGGVSLSLESNEAVIVLEDDIVTSPGFLGYMNDALRRFADDERVVSVHGYSYPTGLAEPFFLRGADCWGWGTWRRGWDLYEPDGNKLLKELMDRGLTSEFNFGDSYAFTRMLEDQIAGRNDSWAVRWYASAFLAGRLTLYPGHSLVQNIGTDGSGTHGHKSDSFDAAIVRQAPDLSGLNITESQAAREAFEEFFRSQGKAPSTRDRKQRRAASRLAAWPRPWST